MTASQIVAQIFEDYQSAEWDYRIANGYDLDAMCSEVEEFAFDDEELYETTVDLLTSKYKSACNVGATRSIHDSHLQAPMEAPA